MRKACTHLTHLNTLSLGVYDGIISSWKGRVLIISGMRKCSKLNFLFGTKFNHFCVNEGVWLTCTVIKDILFIITFFGGMNSYDSNLKRDSILCSLAASISNCTIVVLPNNGFDAENSFYTFLLQKPECLFFESKNLFVSEICAIRSLFREKKNLSSEHVF